MKSIKNLLPIALLISIVPFLFYGEPSIAQSIIVIAVAALAGFRYHLDQKEQPDYVQIFKDQINENTKQSNLIFKKLEDEIKALKEKQGVIGLVEKAESRRNQISW